MQPRITEHYVQYGWDSEQWLEGTFLISCHRVVMLLQNIVFILCILSNNLISNWKITYTFRLTPSSKFINNIESEDQYIQIDAVFTTASTLINPRKAQASIKVKLELEPDIDLSK